MYACVPGCFPLPTWPGYEAEATHQFALIDNSICVLCASEFQWQIERHTGRKITELFDWIVGTSTGGIVALALVYGMCATAMSTRHSCSVSIVACTIYTSLSVCCSTDSFVFVGLHISNTPVQSIVICLLAGKQSLSDLRKFYFRAREDVFEDPKGGVSFDTDALEKMLKHVVGTEMRMNDVTFPR